MGNLFPMTKKKRTVRKRSTGTSARANTSFVAFIEQPHIAAALLVFALIALVLSILEFTNSIAK